MHIPCTAHTTGFQTCWPFGREQRARIDVVPHQLGLPERFLHVEAGGERTVTGRTDHDRVHGVVVLDRVPGARDLLAHEPVERVERARGGSA